MGHRARVLHVEACSASLASIVEKVLDELEFLAPGSVVVVAIDDGLVKLIRLTTALISSRQAGRRIDRRTDKTDRQIDEQYNNTTITQKNKLTHKQTIRHVSGC